MATKYAALRGRIPTEEKPKTPKDLKIEELQDKYVDRSLLNLTAEYNRLDAKAAEEKAVLDATTLERDALDQLIQEQLDAQGADSVSMNGFTWSPGCEPYPSVAVKNLDEVKEYFNTHGMAAQLELTATEMAERLKTIVKEEALANELTIEEVPFVDPQTGEEKTKTEVRSRVPGVKVYLKTSLSRRKSTK